jgi:parallel beta-helix repeat protein
MRTTLALLLQLLVMAMWATTYHVLPNGNNNNSGLSTASPWATLQYAADHAIQGDSVVIHDGYYQGFAAMEYSGVPGDPIVFTCQVDDFGVFIDEPCSYNNLDGINVENVSWVVIEGFTVNSMPRAGIRTALSEHITIRNNSCGYNGKWGILTGFAEHCTIEGNTCYGSVDEHGIYFSNSADDPIIRFNHCYGNNANGIHMNGDVNLGGDGVISNAQVYGNMIHGNGEAGGSGINCDGVVNSVIYNNLLYDNHASGISLYQIDAGGPSTGNRVYNNTIVNASDARWCINITDGCTDNQVINNILVNTHPFRGSIVVAADALDGFVCDFNLVTPRLSPDGDATILDLGEWQALGYDLNSQVVDAQPDLFVGGTDFHPASTNAQMVDAGSTAVESVVATDLDGLPRPLILGYDIGCYEALPASAMPVANATSGFQVRGDALLMNGQHGPLTIFVYDARARLLQSATILSSETTFRLRNADGVICVVVHNEDGQPIWTGRAFVQ